MNPFSAASHAKKIEDGVQSALKPKRKAKAKAKPKPKVPKTPSADKYAKERAARIAQNTKDDLAAIAAMNK
jgi:hypothetical protein